MSKSVQILGGPEDGAVYEVADDAEEIVIARPLTITSDLRPGGEASPSDVLPMQYMTLPLELRPLSQQVRYIARWPRL